MEISFSTEKLRELLCSQTDMANRFGEQTAKGVRSLLSDFRTALFLEEVPGIGALQREDEHLPWPVTDDANLLVAPDKPLAENSSQSISSFNLVHRIRIIAVEVRGEMIR